MPLPLIYSCRNSKAECRARTTVRGRQEKGAGSWASDPLCRQKDENEEKDVDTWNQMKPRQGSSSVMGIVIAVITV